jgi:hypothetical protein
MIYYHYQNSNKNNNLINDIHHLKVYYFMLFVFWLFNLIKE